jgi:hypothetical protein
MLISVNKALLSENKRKAILITRSVEKYRTGVYNIYMEVHKLDTSCHIEIDLKEIKYFIVKIDLK